MLRPPRNPPSFPSRRSSDLLGDLVTGKCVWTFEGHIDRLPFSPNGRHVLSALSARSEEHTSELQSLRHLVCRLLLEKKKKKKKTNNTKTRNKYTKIYNYNTQ